MMMPDLGAYAATVLWAWAVTIVALVGLIGASLWQSRRIKRALMQAQQAAHGERMGENG